jgi:hypothetical protein
MYDVVAALFEGELYLNLESDGFEDGEIGGEILAYDN